MKRLHIVYTYYMQSFSHRSCQMYNNLNIKDKHFLKDNEYLFLLPLVDFQTYNVYCIEFIKE